MPRSSIVIGEKRNRLTLVRKAPPDKTRNTLVECLCDCGETTILSLYNFTSGGIKSCGCLRRDGREHITLEPGARSGRLTFLRELPKSDNKRWIEVRCDCGNVRTIFFYSFNLGHSRSCGCQHGTHHLSQTPVYQAWASILQRCYNPKHPHFDLWGGRGITVCQEWREGFEAFYRDMGPKPTPLHSIDRIDNDGNYEKTNCRWTTKDVNSTNQRRASFLEIGGEKLTFKQARLRSGMSKAGLRARIRKGWPMERLLDPPIPRGQKLVKVLPSRESMSEDSPNGARRTPKHITSRIDWDASKGTLTIDWLDKETTVLNLAEVSSEIQTSLMYWGCIARLQQAYVGAAGDPVKARAKVAKLWSTWLTGDWGLRRGEQSKFSITVKALALLLKIPEGEAQARFAALPVDKRREVSSRSDVVAQVAKLKAKANPLQSLDSILK